MVQTDLENTRCGHQETKDADMKLTRREAEHKAQIIVATHSGTYPSGVTWCNFPELKRAIVAALIEASKIQASPKHAGMHSGHQDAESCGFHSDGRPSDPEEFLAVLSKTHPKSARAFQNLLGERELLRDILSDIKIRNRGAKVTEPLSQGEFETKITKIESKGEER